MLFQTCTDNTVVLCSDLGSEIILHFKAESCSGSCLFFCFLFFFRWARLPFCKIWTDFSYSLCDTLYVWLVLFAVQSFSRKMKIAHVSLCASCLASGKNNLAHKRRLAISVYPKLNQFHLHATSLCSYKSILLTNHFLLDILNISFRSCKANP